MSLLMYLSFYGGSEKLLNLASKRTRYALLERDAWQRQDYKKYREYNKKGYELIKEEAKEGFNLRNFISSVGMGSLMSVATIIIVVLFAIATILAPFTTIASYIPLTLIAVYLVLDVIISVGIGVWQIIAPDKALKSPNPLWERRKGLLYFILPFDKAKKKK